MCVNGEARRILLYGDGDLSPSELVWMAYRDEDVIVCDSTEAGTYVASGLAKRGYELACVKLMDVLAENPFAAVVAPGCDRMRRQVVYKAKAKTSIELLAYITRVQPHF